MVFDSGSGNASMPGVILVGQAYPRQKQIDALAPLLAPIYYLSAPEAQPQPQLAPLAVGNRAHMLTIRRWQQMAANMPGHPLITLLKTGLPQDLQEAAQTRWEIKNLLRGGKEVKSADWAILRFLLLASLDENQAQQDAIYAKYQELRRNLSQLLDQWESPEHSDPAPLPVSYLMRLDIWAGAARIVELPPALCAMESGLFNAWQESRGQASVPCAVLPLPVRRHKNMAGLQRSLYDFQQDMTSMDNKQASSRLLRTWHGLLKGDAACGKWLLYCLPAHGLAPLFPTRAHDLLCISFT